MDAGSEKNQNLEKDTYQSRSKHDSFFPASGRGWEANGELAFIGNFLRKKKVLVGDLSY